MYRTAKSRCAPVRHLPTAVHSLLVLLLVSTLPAAPAQAQPIDLTEGLAIRTGRHGRSAIVVDSVLYALATSRFHPPAERERLDDGDETRTWEPLAAEEEGYFRSRTLRGGYLYVPVVMERPTVMILEASGHSTVYINGVPRAGDVYDYGWIAHPVQLEAGRNDLLFYVQRGRMRARLVPPEAETALTTKDMTLPDLIIGEEAPVWGAVRIVHAGEAAQGDLQLRSRVSGGEALVTEVPLIGPMTSRKVGFRISGAAASAPEGEVNVTLELLRDGRTLDTATFQMNVFPPSHTHKRTFVSEIDGSIQYYSVVPGRLEGDAQPALFLSLHGASVEATNQAAVYEPKTWGHVVAPTNRRPYGFDWEDWGRLDAMEVLAREEQRLGTDPRRTYLTGHSMGGHGTWQVGVTYPDRFAAIAPFAGWYSFWSYGLRPPEPSPLSDALLRAANPSNTLGLSKNYLHHGVYIVHGDQDRTVPVTQARFMRKHLGEYHPDFAYYEVHGAGHWWGDESLDFPPVFDYFRWHRIPRPAEIDTLRFTTASPGVSSTSHWVTIYGQQQPLALSSVVVAQDTARAAFSGTTENVSRLALDAGHFSGRDTVRVALDGQEFVFTGAAPERLWFARDGETWAVAAAPSATQKGPHRYGTFKDAFRHRMIFVYGTRGTEEENAWSYDKARYDAETFWYRGNGSVDVIADVDFDASAAPDRSVILYGNADTNAAWEDLLADSPVQVRRGAVDVDGRVLEGGDLGALFIRPRPGSDVASVGVVSGTGLPGFRTAFPNPYFSAGSGYPDLFVFSADMLRTGAAGVRAWGYFGEDWSVARGDILWP